MNDLSRLAAAQHTGNDADRQQEREHQRRDRDSESLSARGVETSGSIMFVLELSPVITHSPVHGFRGFRFALSVDKAVHQRDENSVANVAIERPPMTARQRCILLSAFAQSEGHGQHADDHRKGGHDDGAQTRGTCRDRGIQGRMATLALLFGEGHQQDGVGSRDADGHDAPIRLGTLNVVWVRKSAHTIPQKAPGSAQIMMKGSSQLW